MIVRRVALAALSSALAACGAGKAPESAKSSADAVVEIPEVTDEQAKKSSRDEALPASRRSEPPRVAEVSAEEEPPESADNPWGQPGWGSTKTGGPDCDRAADCCLKFIQRNGPDPSLQSVCDSVRRAPSPACSQYLASFKSIAPSIGVQCK